MPTEQYYDQIGVGYADARRADPVIAAQVFDALGDAQTIVNVGAGTGNYEPPGRELLAVEPNHVMAAQRTSPAPVVQAFAETLPLRDNSFEAALAMFTIHHWTNREAGLRELGRVARRQVALVYDASVSRSFWLFDFFDGLNPDPPIPNPSASWVAQYLRLVDERVLRIPRDCTDGFAGCYWNRPERYLDPQVQAGMSVLARLSDAQRARGSQRLAASIESGEWDAKHGHLREMEEFDIGYRLVICNGLHEAHGRASGDYRTVM